VVEWIMGINNIEQFCNQFRILIEDKKEWPDFLKNGREMLSELVLNPGWFRQILSRLLIDDDFLKSQLYCMEPNEIQIYRDPDHLFSIRAYVWEPNGVYPIHDHGSWGIIGTHINQIKEKKFVRLDDGKDENYAKIKQIYETDLFQGDTTYMLPMDEGIHQIQTFDDKIAVTIHVYGTPVRKGFIRYFNKDTNAVKRIYSPSLNKKMFAMRVLDSISES